MVIQHNMAAMHALRQENINGHNKKKAAQRLSSGYRINSAADDAARLSISEGMRAQIRGLNQAKRNVEDGINLVKTADGGLNEIHDILNCIRTLSVKSANDTNTDSDRAAIQEEVQQLQTEITRIAYTTEFNGIHPLLKDTQTAGEAIPDISYAAELDRFTIKDGPQGGIFMFIPGMSGYAGAIGDYGNGGCAKIRLLNDDGTTTELKLGSNSPDGYGTYTPSATSAVYEYNNPVTGIHFKVEQTCEIVDIIDADTQKGGQYFKPTYTLTNLGNNFRYDMYLHLDPINGSMSAPPSKDNSVLTGTTGYVPGVDGDISIICNPSSYPTNCDVTARYTGDHITNPPDAVLAGFVRHDGNAGGTAGNLDDLYHIKNGTFTPSGGSPDYHFSAGWLDRTIGTGGSYTVDMLFGLSYPVTFTGGGGQRPKNEIWIQAGANSGQGYYIPLCDSRISTLGIDNINVLTHDSSTDAIDKIDQASEKISSYRSVFGAYQNRMEASALINGNSAENLQAAESKMRDADMAEEMVEFSKSSILEQAIQSMLSQANQQPQTVLSLLN